MVKKNTYIVGDMNINLLNHKTNNNAKSYLNLIFQWNFLPVINRPTRESSRNATLIDHILTNNVIDTKMFTVIIM